MVHTIDCVFVYDGGATWTSVTNSPNGSCIAVWQNKVWVAGDPDQVSRFYACKAADVMTWNKSEDYNDVREKDNAPIVALGTGQGRDQDDVAGLMVFKQNWWGRITDARSGTSFGKYNTMHNYAGAASPHCVTSTHD